MITNNNNNNQKMTTQVITMPRFMLTLGKVATENRKIQQEALKQRKQDKINQKKALSTLIREVNIAEKDAKKKAKLLAKEAKLAIKTIIANHKKQEKIQLKMKATIAKKEAKSEIVKLNKTIYRQKKSISTLKEKM